MKHNIPIIGTSIWYQIDNRPSSNTIDCHRIDDAPIGLNVDDYAAVCDYLNKRIAPTHRVNASAHHYTAEHENCVHVNYVQNWDETVAYFSSDKLTVSRKPFKLRTYICEYRSNNKLAAWLCPDTQTNAPHPYHCHRSFDLPISPDMLPAPGKLELKISSIAGEFKLNISGYLQVDPNRPIRQQAAEAVAGELEKWQSNLAQHLNKQREITGKLKYENK